MAEPRRWVALAGICAAAGLVWLAFADLGVALPTISTEPHVTMTDLQWANNAFSLACGALVLAAGRFTDLYGRRRILLLGVAVFGAFSLLTAFLSGLGGLVLGRALMGVGAAMILPATLALIPPMFPRAEQPRAFGAWMAVAWVGQAAGPAVGGALTSLLGWRSLFWTAALVAAVAYVVIRRYTPESRDENAPRGIDVIGLATSAGAAFCLLFALTEGQSTGFGDPLILTLLGAAVVLAVLFVVAERRLRNPLVDLRLFRARDFDGALTANLVMNVVFAGISFLLALYLQDVRGYSAIEAGLLLFPSTLTILAFNPTGGRLAQRRGARTPGAGLGLLSIPVSDTASGLFKMSSMLGGAFGVALLAAVAKALGTREATAEAQAAGLTQAQMDQLANALTGSDAAGSVLDQLPAATRDAVVAAYRQAEVVGAAGAVKLAGVLALLSVPVLLWLWPRRRVR
jgi:MFS family permease